MSVSLAVSAADALRDAQDRVYRWPASFRGFEARLRLSTESATVGGAVWVTGALGLALDLDDGAGEDEWEWGIEQIRSMALHYWPRGGADREPAFPARYREPPSAGGDAVVLVEDPMHSTYWIRDGQITEISRQLPTLRLRVLIRDRIHASDGRWLPRQSTTILSDRDGGVREVDVITDSWQVAGPLAWPTRREVVTECRSGTVARSLQLSDHRELIR